MADASLCVCVVCSVFGTLLSAACATERFAHLKRGITRSIVPSMKSYIYPQKYGRILQRPPVFGALPPFAPPARRWRAPRERRALRFAPALRALRLRRLCNEGCQERRWRALHCTCRRWTPSQPSTFSAPCWLRIPQSPHRMRLTALVRSSVRLHSGALPPISWRRSFAVRA